MRAPSTACKFPIGNTETVVRTAFQVSHLDRLAFGLKVSKLSCHVRTCNMLPSRPRPCSAHLRNRSRSGPGQIYSSPECRPRRPLLTMAQPYRNITDMQSCLWAATAPSTSVGSLSSLENSDYCTPLTLMPRWKGERGQKSRRLEVTPT